MARRSCFAPILVSFIVFLLMFAPTHHQLVHGQASTAQPQPPPSTKEPTVTSKPPSKDGSAQGPEAAAATSPSHAPVIDLPPEVRQQLDDIQNLIKATHELAQNGPSVRGDFGAIKQSLDDIKSKVEPSLFQEVWQSYVGNVVWEFFGIKRGESGRPSIVGRIVSLLGLLIAGLKLRYWMNKSSSTNGTGQKVVNGLWLSYAVVLVCAFVVLSWSGASTQMDPKAVEFHDSVVRASNELQALQTLPTSLQSIDRRLASIESRPTGPSFITGLFRAILWLTATFACVVGGVAFYKNVLE